MICSARRDALASNPHIGAIRTDADTPIGPSTGMS